MLCNEGKLTNHKKGQCKFYVGRTYMLDDIIVEEHYCNNGFISEIAETSEEYNLINLNGKQIRTCNAYIPEINKSKKKKINTKKTGKTKHKNYIQQFLSWFKLNGVKNGK